MKHIVILTFAACLPWLSGCTFIVAGATKNFDSMLSEQPSNAKVEKALGQPVKTDRFESAVSVPEPAIPSAIHDRPILAASVATYEYRGRADDMERFQALGMISGLTFGVGEVVTFPMSLSLSTDLSRHVHEYTVWYSANGTCVGYTHHDLSEPSRDADADAV